MLDDERLELIELLELERMLEETLDAFDEDELLLELVDVLMTLRIEHSFFPPATLEPVPNVLSRQIKPPLSSL